MRRTLPVVTPDPPVVSTDQYGVTWRRTGGCCRCGECCVGDPYGGAGSPPTVEGMCPHFALTEDGVGACSDRDNYYYRIACAHWPQFPAQVADKPSCSYRFEKVEVR